MEKIYDDIISQLDKPLKFDELAVSLKTYSKKELKKAFEKLIAKGLILPAKSRKYANLAYFNIIIAKFLATDKGFGFCEPEIPLASGRDVFIPEKYTNSAWHGDKVLVKLLKSRYKRDKKGERQEGEIIRILERPNKVIIGKLKCVDNFYYVLPDKHKYPPISIDDTKLNFAKEGDRVSVYVKYFGNFEYLPQGEINKVFGAYDSRESNINAILFSHNIHNEFSKLALMQTKSIKTKITQDMFGDRLDLTQKMIFTIDGTFSKDFDDAVSLEKLENGNLKLGVHIADVSHYVTQDSPLDLDAFDRGTSVYFGNKVVPMLPFELSNGICSLNPNENRFALSVFMEIDNNLDVIKSEFYKSVIESKYRLTYDNVNKLLDGDSNLCMKYAEIVDIICEMNTLAKKLEQKSRQKGALELEIDESTILFDENDMPVDVVLRTRGDSEKLIEQFMVLCNSEVAKYMNKNEFPAVYRIHEPPNIDKLKIFKDFAKLFNFKLSDDDLLNPVALQAVLNESSGTAYHKTLATFLLRSLSRARYEEKCLGHSGLALDNYLHFTSPIRRYPDLCVHRMLTKKIDLENYTRDDFDYCQAAALQSTIRERHADDASRDIEKIYKAEYMSKFIGEEFFGVVSGVQNYGIFVELKNSIEGLVRIADMPDDNYIFDDETISITATNSKKIYTIGTQVKVKLVNANVTNGQIDFTLL